MPVYQEHDIVRSRLHWCAPGDGPVHLLAYSSGMSGVVGYNAERGEGAQFKEREFDPGQKTGQ